MAKAKKHVPTAKAKAAYAKLITKSTARLVGVMEKRNPSALKTILKKHGYT